MKSLVLTTLLALGLILSSMASAATRSRAYNDYGSQMTCDDAKAAIRKYVNDKYESGQINDPDFLDGLKVLHLNADAVCPQQSYGPFPRW